jgi:hypothetical protein
MFLIPTTLKDFTNATNKANKLFITTPVIKLKNIYYRVTVLLLQMHRGGVLVSQPI